VTGLAIRLVVIGLIVGGGILFRDRLTSGATDLKVGDCFDDSTSTTEVKDVQHHPCTDRHTAEVVLTTDYPAPKGAPYPGRSGMSSYSDQTCTTAVLSYVGLSGNLDALNYGIYFPKEPDWNSGDRWVICYVTTANGSPITGSLKGH
jgi:putative regulator of septum formation